MSETPANIPTATVRPERRISLVWIVPMLAVLAVGWLGYRAWLDRGTIITIAFDQAHGLRVGDPVRFRGANVGEVREIIVSEDLGRLLMDVRLEPGAAHLARAGTQFWIVRAHVGLDGTTGLETIVGPRYIACAPGANSENTPPARHFTGLPRAPLVDPGAESPGSIEIVLRAANRGSLTPGAPVLYRQFRIGTILSVDLTEDAGGIEAIAHVDGRYLPLVRENSRFWDVGGYSARLGWRGLSFEVESFQTFVTGGVAMATPPNDRAGSVVDFGHRFEVATEPQKSWLEWQPMISLAGDS